MKMLKITMRSLALTHQVMENPVFGYLNSVDNEICRKFVVLNSIKIKLCLSRALALSLQFSHRSKCFHLSPIPSFHLPLCLFLLLLGFCITTTYSLGMAKLSCVCLLESVVFALALAHIEMVADASERALTHTLSFRLHSHHINK